MTKFRRRAEVVRFGNNLINFAALALNQTNSENAEYANKRIFELLNPTNKFQKTISFDFYNAYKSHVESNSFSFEKFQSYLNFVKLRNDFEKSTIINKIHENDYTELNKIRAALFEDMKLTPVVVLADHTINPVDFYFDSLKPYDEYKCNGIVLSEDGILNSNEINCTIFINKNYLLEILKGSADDVDYIKSIKVSFWAAIIRDNMRIRNTEKLLLLTDLITKLDYSFINTLSEKYKLYCDERYNNLKSEMEKVYEKEFNVIREKGEFDSIDFKNLFEMISYIKSDIHPLSLISIIELCDNALNEILKSLNLIDSDTSLSFGSTSKLIENDENELCEKIKKSILVGRLLPICFFNTYFLNEGTNFSVFQKIDKVLEDYVHHVKFSFDNTDGSSRIWKIHESNDEFYDKLRNAFKNPLIYTSGAIMGIKDTVFNPVKIANPNVSGE